MDQRPERPAIEWAVGVDQTHRGRVRIAGVRPAPTESQARPLRGRFRRTVVFEPKGDHGPAGIYPAPRGS